MHRVSSSSIALFLFAFAAPALAGCVAEERVYVAAPPRRVVVVERRPAVVWVPGHWVQHGGARIWVDGHWRRI